MTDDKNIQPDLLPPAGSIISDAPNNLQKLDDVLIAMDIVDTLRHREHLVLREMDADAREKELIQRLKDIYTAQGIEVSDDKLRDGVKALEENRFVYTPTKESWKTKLAIIYIKRDKWFKPARNGFAAFLLATGFWHFGIDAPQKEKARSSHIELTQTFPSELLKLRDNIQSIAVQDQVKVRAETFYQDGLLAIEKNEHAQAKAALTALTTLAADLEVEYTVRIVSRPGEYSVLQRSPIDTPQNHSYYAVVEALDGAGRVITVPIVNFEDQSSKRVAIWGVRISKAEYDRIAKDKQDDSIVQNALIGNKTKGQLVPEYTIDALGGTIISW